MNNPRHEFLKFLGMVIISLLLLIGGIYSIKQETEMPPEEINYQLSNSNRYS